MSVRNVRTGWGGMSALTDTMQDPSIPGHPSCDVGETSSGPPAHSCPSQYGCVRGRMHIAAGWAGLTCRRAYPDLNQGPADLQSAALTTELYTHVDRCSTLRGHLVVLRFGLRLFGTRRKASWGRLGWFRVSLRAVPGSAHQLSSARGGHGSRCVTVCNRNAGWRDWCSPCTRCRGHARQHQCHHAGLHVHVSMHVDRLGEGVQGKTLPGRLELPTLRLTASRSNQLS